MRKSNIKLIESSVRVDMVAMPRFTIKELKNINMANAREEKSTAGAATIKEDRRVDTDKDFIQEKESSFADMLKNIGEKNFKGKKRKGKIDKKGLSKLRGLVLEGNKLSKGEALVGTGNDMELSQFESYLSNIPSHVRPFWKLPSYLLNQDLNCRLQVFLSSSGKVIRIEIYESSGNDVFDQKAIDAVRRSSPLPSPEKEFLYRTTRGDIILGFPL